MVKPRHRAQPLKASSATINDPLLAPPAAAPDSGPPRRVCALWVMGVGLFMALAGVAISVLISRALDILVVDSIVLSDPQSAGFAGWLRNTRDDDLYASPVVFSFAFRFLLPLVTCRVFGTRRPRAAAPLTVARLSLILFRVPSPVPPFLYGQEQAPLQAVLALQCHQP